MSRSLALAFAAAVFATPLVSARADAGLVRIEPRPYYGAVVSIENGVRVYRPLPAPHLTIINPNRTPVNLSFNRTVEQRSSDGGSSGGAYGGGDGDYGVRYGGISGLGNGIIGTNPHFRKRAVAAGYGFGVHRAKSHVRRIAKKHH